MNKQPDLAIIALDADTQDSLPPWIISLREHIQQVEPALTVCWSISTCKARIDLLDGFDLVIQSGEHEHPGYRLNLLLSAVRSPFVLWANAFWCFESSAAAKYLRSAIVALESNNAFAQVKLHTQDTSDFTDKSIYSGPVCEAGGTPFYIQSPRKILGGIALSPAITKLEALRRLGPLRENSSSFAAVEAEYCARSTLAENHLALRAPGFAPFRPHASAPYTAKDLLVENP